MIDGMLQIVTRSGRTEANGSQVLFFFGLQFIDTLGRPADADDQHARSEGIERPGMSHFNFAVPQPTQQYAHLAHDIRRSPPEGLVHRKHVSFREGKIRHQRLFHNNLSD